MPRGTGSNGIPSEMNGQELYLSEPLYHHNPSLSTFLTSLQVKTNPKMSNLPEKLDKKKKSGMGNLLDDRFLLYFDFHRNRCHITVR